MRDPLALSAQGDTMSISLPRLAGKAAAVAVIAGGLTLGSAGIANAGEVVIIDDGRQCTALYYDNGSWSNWWMAR
jgi:redox-sensitive bicupin YhaK (pirin superfamily)